VLAVNARFVTQNITGVQRYAIELSRQLKKLLGDKVHFVSPKNIAHLDLAEELDIHIVGNRTGHLWEQIDLPMYLKSIASPILLNLGNTAPLFYSNKISTVHDIAYERFARTFSWKFRLFYKILIPKLIISSKHIITVSEFSKKEISDFYKTDDKKISVVYHSVSEKFKPSVKKNSEKYILAVSSLNYRKNLQSLVKAFNQLNDSKVKLFLVGDKNRNFDNSKPPNEIENNPNIVFKAHVDDDELIYLYSNAICFVYPSLYEGFGIPPLEAQACGCPVICSNVASLPEVYRDSVLYCNPYDIDDIKEKIILVSNNEALRNELRQKGFENIRRFSCEQSAKKLLEIIERF